MKRTAGRKTRHAEGFAVRAADVTDLESLLGFVKAYYDSDGIPYWSERIRTALDILLRDRSLGRAWIIRYGRKRSGTQF
jgi:hypothetical protein